MSSVIFHSRSLSLYLRIATLICEEKGVGYQVEPLDAPGEGFRRLHPFEKMPVLQHGDVLVYETLAIADYVDRVFEGPELSPSSALAHAEMMRWISLTNAYFFPTMMGGIVKPLLLAPLSGDPVDKDLVEASLPALQQQVALLEKRLSGHEYLAGEALSLGDLFVLPNLAYVNFTEEGQAALESAPGTRDWLARLTSRPGFAASEQRV